MQKQKGFIFYLSDISFMELLDGDSCKKLMFALSDYIESGKMPEKDNAALYIAFLAIKNHLDVNKEKYEQVSEKRRAAAEKRWGKTDNADNNDDANADSAYCLHYDNDKEKDKDKDKDNVKVKDKDKDKDKDKERSEISDAGHAHWHQRRFEIPALNEITDYCRKRKSKVSAESFFDYYSARGWQIDGHKIADWKALIRRWETNGIDDICALPTNECKTSGIDVAEIDRWVLEEYKRANSSQRAASVPLDPVRGE